MFQLFFTKLVKIRTMPEEPKKIFPKNFLWGASTSAYQVEGGNHNQWSVWEQANADRLANTAEKRISWTPRWHEIKSLATKPDNYVSGKAVDHYHRYKEDFELVKKLNLNSFRFGIEWSRLEPKEGQFDQEAIEHYRSYIAELKKRDIEPVLNIWHWTYPQWFAKKGAFKKSANIFYFERLVKLIADELAAELKYVITINEPNIYGSLSYFTGEWPPQEKSFIAFARVYRNLTIAHKRAFKILKEKHPWLQIGIAHNIANIQAKRPHNFFDQFSTKVMRYYWDWWFLMKIRHHQDYVGVNYYFTDYYTGIFKRQNPNIPLNDIGFYMEPEGLYPVLLRTWARFKKPIMVSENGVADMDDQYRHWWIEESLVAMERAMSEGVNVIGYFHWSLLDNFEWSYGWWPRFGLVAVDREHDMNRTIRPSAKWFAEKIKQLS